jgi:hypothetical protein
VIFKLDIPPAYLPGGNAPQAERAIGVLRWADQAGRLRDVDCVVAQVKGVR